MKHSSRQLAFVALLLGTLVGAQAQASTTYTVDETITGPVDGIAGNPTQTDSVVGSITTDGTMGVLHALNIQSWNLDLIDVTNPVYSIDLTQLNSSVSVDLGSVLNAKPTGLFFDFTSSGVFGFQANSPGRYSGYHYWCLSQNYTYYCLNGNSIAPGNVYAGYPGNDLVVAATGTQGQVGNSPLDQGVPEPATWAMMLVGFGGLGAAMRSRRKVGSAAA